MIENAGIELEMLHIEVKELEQFTEQLNERKDRLIEEKRMAEVRNEELKKDYATN